MNCPNAVIQKHCLGLQNKAQSVGLKCLTERVVSEIYEVVVREQIGSIDWQNPVGHHEDGAFTEW